MDGELAAHAGAADAAEHIKLQWCGLGQMKPGGLDFEVFHEEAADEVVVVTETFLGLGAGGQQEAGVLDGVAGEDEILCFYLEGLSGEVADGEVFDGLDRFVGVDRGDVRIGVEVNILRFFYGVAIFCSEAGGRAELPDLVPDGGVIFRQEGLECGIFPLPVFYVILIGTEVEDFLGLGVIGVEVGFFNRPAAMGDPVSFFEVHGVECGAEAGPVVAGAAEVMQAG